MGIQIYKTADVIVAINCKNWLLEKKFKEVSKINLQYLRNPFIDGFLWAEIETKI